MSGIGGSFDASQFKPNQGGGAHPIGNGFDFTIVSTEIKPTKDQTGGIFVVEFQTPAGRIRNNYNLWNQSPKAVEIAHGQLSALCHATGIFRLDWTNEGKSLVGGRGKLDVGLQNANEPDGYVEVKKVYDQQGNEPGRAPNPAPQPQSAPMTQSPQGWGQPAPQQQQPAPQAPAGWQQPPQQPVAQGGTPTPPWGAPQR